MAEGTRRFSNGRTSGAFFRWGPQPVSAVVRGADEVSEQSVTEPVQNDWAKVQPLPKITKAQAVASATDDPAGKPVSYEQIAHADQQDHPEGDGAAQEQDDRNRNFQQARDT